MNFGQLKTISRQLVPEANENDVKDPELGILVNAGALEVARRAICLPTSKKFDSEADIDTYNLTSKLDRFLVMDKEGVWYRTSTTTNYAPLFPKTLKWFDENRPNWRDMDSGDPTHYAIDGDEMIVSPPNDEAITNAFWVYYGQAPEEMTENDHFPFGGETEIHRLKVFSMAIVKYVDWQLVEATKEGIDNYISKEREFEREIKKQLDLIKKRPDIEAHRDTKMKMGGVSDSF